MDFMKGILIWCPRTLLVVVGFCFVSSGFCHFGFPFCMAVAREVASLYDPASKLSGHKEVHPGQIVQSYTNLPQTHLAMLLLR